MKNAGFLIFVFSIFLSCEEKTDPIKPPLSISGRWTIETVWYDGNEQDEWETLEFDFEQRSDSTGVYFLRDTPYDSIWKSTGTWTITSSSNVNHITFDDSLNVKYEVNGNRLIFITYLPWTAMETCKDGFCLPMVSGIWHFKMKR